MDRLEYCLSTKAPIFVEHKFLSKDAIQDSIYDWISSVHKFWTNLSLDNKKLIIWGCSAKFLFTYSALELEKFSLYH